MVAIRRIGFGRIWLVIVVLIVVLHDRPTVVIPSGLMPIMAAEWAVVITPGLMPIMTAKWPPIVASVFMASFVRWMVAVTGGFIVSVTVYVAAGTVLHFV